MGQWEVLRVGFGSEGGTEECLIKGSMIYERGMGFNYEIVAVSETREDLKNHSTHC